jgi:1,4-dihydroxy-2-naphthoyl-CoA hydrolase
VVDDAAAAFLREAMPLCALLGVHAEANTADSVVLSLEWKPELCTGGGLLHGGAIMALADSAGGALAFANLPEGGVGTSTIESKTNFLGGVKEGTITATATVLHKGSMTIVIETSVRDHTDRLVAKVMQTQAVLRPRT